MAQTSTLSPPARLDESVSRRMRFFSLLAMLLLVYVHGYNLKMNYLQPFTMVDEPLSFTTFFEYFTANGLFRFRIPVLFAISGYLFARSDYKPHGQRALSRFRTLGIPYLLWSAIGLGITYLWELSPFLCDAATDSMLKGDQIMVKDYDWHRLLAVWAMDPVPFQLWFIRNLLVLNLMYPVFAWFIRKFPRGYLYTLAFFWVLGFILPGLVGLYLDSIGQHVNLPPIEVEGVFFFSLGIAMQKQQYDLNRVPLRLPLAVWAGLWIGLCLLKTWIAFVPPDFFQDRNQTMIIVRFISLILMYKVVVFAGLITVWFGMRRFADRAMQIGWVAWLCGFTFIIYGFHEPILHYATTLIFHYAYPFQYYRLVTYICLPMAIVAVCVAFGAALRAVWPKGYSVLTGGRGI